LIKKTLHFGNPAYISLKDSQLWVQFPKKGEDSEKIIHKSVPLEDIGIIILENHQITITHSLLSALLENNAAIVTCDKTHMPNGLMLSMEGNNIQSKRFRFQFEASLPLKKQLWQQTVQAKILNQAGVLANLNIEYKNMIHWANSVKSGDSENHEGRAAAYYWKNLFHEESNFKRGREGEPPNNLLNYGYAILRAITARALVGSGLLPTLGIHHKNKYNAYCLADDIMEPFRPYVDQIVIEILKEEPKIYELNNSIKSKLLSIATTDVSFNKEKSPLQVGIQKTTASLAKCFEGISKKINFPEISIPKIESD